MKFIFMLLILFLLTDPTIAKPVDTTSTCLNMYGNYLKEYGTGELIPETQMRDFIGRCLPDDSTNNYTRKPAYIDGTQHQKLLRSTDNKTVTVKA